MCGIRIATPTFFCFPLAWNIFFHPLTFSLYVFLGLKWVSCRQHIYRSCFCIHSASLCLLVGAFNPFTFKVIIGMYVHCVGYVSVGLFDPLLFYFFCDLMVNFSVVFGILFNFCVCIYYRFLICCYHEVLIQ